MIRSAKFSFVRFEHPVDNDYSLDIPFSLPAFDEHDVAFQFIVDEDRAISSPIKLGIADKNGTFISAFSGPAINASIQSYRYRIAGLLGYTSFNLTSITVGATTITYSLTGVTYNQFSDILFDDFGIELIEDYFILETNPAVSIVAVTTFTGSIPSYWHQGHVLVSGRPIVQTDVFTYALLEVDDSILGYSNVFKIIDEEAFTSILTYSSNESNFDFIYNSIENIIRLPIYLKQPQFPKTRTVDKKSTGTKKLLAGFVEKEYLVETEQMPEVFHECFAIALAHDNVRIENKNIREIIVDVIETENYGPDWEGDGIQFAKGKGKLKVANYGYSNSNC